MALLSEGSSVKESPEDKQASAPCVRGRPLMWGAHILCKISVAARIFRWVRIFCYTGMWYVWLQLLHHSYAFTPSSALDHATTLHPLPMSDSLSHAQSKGDESPLCDSWLFWVTHNPHASTQVGVYSYSHPSTLVLNCAVQMS